MNNRAFVDDSNDDEYSVESDKPTMTNGFASKNSIWAHSNEVFSMESTDTIESSADSEKQRENWGNSIEFLMSCIAMSVGLGNVWRFPFSGKMKGKKHD